MLMWPETSILSQDTGWALSADSAVSANVPPKLQALDTSSRIDILPVQGQEKHLPSHSHWHQHSADQPWRTAMLRLHRPHPSAQHRLSAGGMTESSEQSCRKLHPDAIAVETTPKETILSMQKQPHLADLQGPEFSNQGRDSTTDKNAHTVPQPHESAPILCRT